MSLEIVQIIEDEPLHAQLLDCSLRKGRYRTNVAGDGVTGLADVKRLNPSLVLLDVRRNRRLLDEGPATGDDALSIEEHCLKITLSGRRLTVTQPEWRLLQLLSKKLDQIVPIEELASLIWSDSEFLRHRDLDAIIATLNDKVRSASSGSIEVIPRIGYRLLPPHATG